MKIFDTAEILIPKNTEHEKWSVVACDQYTSQKEYWEEVLADYPDQTDKIVEFLRSRLNEAFEERDVRRAIDALLRRGHSYQEIRKAMQELTFDADFQEDY